MQAFRIIVSILVCVLLYILFHTLNYFTFEQIELKPNNSVKGEIKLEVDNNNQVFKKFNSIIYEIKFNSKREFKGGLIREVIIGNNNAKYDIESLKRQGILPYYTFHRKITEDTYVVYLNEIIDKDIKSAENNDNRTKPDELTEESTNNQTFLKSSDKEAIVFLSSQNAFESKVFKETPIFFRAINGGIQFLTLFVFVYLVMYLMLRRNKFLSSEARIRDSIKLNGLRKQIREGKIKYGQYGKIAAQVKDGNESPYMTMLKRCADLLILEKKDYEITPLVSELYKLEKDKIQNEYLIANYLVWVLPIIGFIGTIVGISGSMGETGGMKNPDNLVQLEANFNITGSLFTAFDTTLVALLLYGIGFKLVSYFYKKDNNNLEESWQHILNFLSFSSAELEEVLVQKENEIQLRKDELDKELRELDATKKKAEIDEDLKVTNMEEIDKRIEEIKVKRESLENGEE